MTTATFCPAHADKVLQRVIDRLDHAVSVANASDVATALLGRFEQRPAQLRIDLVAHSRKRLLHLDNWTVDDNAATVDMQAALAVAGALAGVPIEIRLLGCNTAVRPEGRDAMIRLVQRFGAQTRVWGTTQPVSADDFDDGKFTAMRILVDQNGAPFAAGLPLQGNAGWFTRLAGVPTETVLGQLLDSLVAETDAELQDDWQRTAPVLRWPIVDCTRAALRALILDFAEPSSARVAGLLALPELELAAPVSDGHAERLTVLLDGALVRVYPKGVPEGALLYMRNTSDYQAAVAALARGKPWSSLSTQR